MFQNWVLWSHFKWCGFQKREVWETKLWEWLSEKPKDNEKVRKSYWSVWEPGRISLSLFLETSVRLCVCFGGWVEQQQQLASRNVPGAFSFLPRPRERVGRLDTRLRPTAPGQSLEVSLSVSVCVCPCSAGLWPSVLLRTKRKCEATGPRKRMPSSCWSC